MSIDLGEPVPLKLRVEEAFEPTLFWNAKMLSDKSVEEEAQQRKLDEEHAKTIMAK